jgi:cell wall-associated NlpC family hydrolase
MPFHRFHRLRPGRTLGGNHRPLARRRPLAVAAAGLAGASVLSVLAVVSVAAWPARPAAASSLVRTPSPIADAAQAALDVMHGVSADPEPQVARPARPSMDRAELAGRRREVAAQVAAALDLDPAALDAAWVAAGRDRLTVVLTALAQVGVRYRYADADPSDGFDCSGLTEYAWASVGVDLPHASDTQLRAGVRRGADQAQVGDLIGYSGHVMLYLGIDQAIIHAPYSGRNVEVQIARRWSGRFTDPSQPVA